MTKQITVTLILVIATVLMSMSFIQNGNLFAGFIGAVAVWLLAAVAFRQFNVLERRKARLNRQ